MKNAIMLVMFFSMTTSLLCLQPEVPAQTTTRSCDGNHATQLHRTRHRKDIVQSYVQKLIARATPEAYTQSCTFKLILMGVELACYPVDAVYNRATTWWDILTCLGPT